MNVRDTIKLLKLPILVLDDKIGDEYTLNFSATIPDFQYNESPRYEGIAIARRTLTKLI